MGDHFRPFRFGVLVLQQELMAENHQRLKSTHRFHSYCILLWSREQKAKKGFPKDPTSKAKNSLLLPKHQTQQSQDNFFQSKPNPVL